MGRQRIAYWSCAAVLGVLVGFRELVGWDLWWHLLIGKVAVQQATTLPSEVFSYTAQGTAWAYKDLGADVVLYGAYAAAGPVGIALLQLAVVLGIAGAVWIAVPSDRRSLPVLLGVLAVVVAGAHARIIPRPVMFTVGMFPVLLALLERARAAPTWGNFAAVVAVQWAWLNLHRGGLVGLVFLGGFALYLWLARWLPLESARPRPRAARRAGIAFVAAAVLGLVNPSGSALYTTGIAAVRSPALREYISDWSPLTWDLAVSVMPIASGLVLVTWVALVATMVAARKTGRESPVTLWHLGALAVCTYLGVSAIRWLALAAAGAGVMVAVMSAWWVQGRSGPRGLSGLVAVLGVIVVHGSHPGALGVGQARHRYPAGAVTFAAEQGLGPHVHNTFEYGGYLLWRGWPDFQVAVDGRHDIVFSGEHVLRCARAQVDPMAFSELVADYPPDWVLADNTPGRESFRFLAGDAHWELVYWSEPAVIYVPAGRYAHLASARYQFLRPGQEVPSLGRALQWAAADPARLAAVRAELQRMYEPSSVRGNALMVLFHHAVGQFRERDFYFEQLVELAPEHSAVAELRQRLGL